MVATRAEVALAHRLRQLRREGPLGKLTQPQLADAFGVSVQVISSWESERTPKAPSLERLSQYARLFATPRSLSDGNARLIDVHDLAEDERRAFDALNVELRSLRAAAQGRVEAVRSGAQEPAPRFWQFDDGRPVTIIGSEQPASVLASVPEADRHHPDHVHLLRHADADAVLELAGEIRACNPDSPVTIKLPSEVVAARDLTHHVVVIGGGSVNRYAEWFTHEVGLAIEAQSMTFPTGLDPKEWGSRRFRVRADLVEKAVSAGLVERDEELQREADGHWYAFLKPELRDHVVVERPGPSGEPGTQEVWPNLYRDLALIARQQNPLQPQATATLMHGLFSRGTFGAVTALTDPELARPNGEFLARRFRGNSTYWLLISVFCDRRLPVIVTPDLTDPTTRLVEWPPPGLAAR